MPDEGTPLVPLPTWRWPMAALVFVTVLLILACYEHSRDWNSASRFLLTHALADHGTVEVTGYVAPDGRLLANPPTRDLAVNASKDQYFCDKAPGLSVLGTIPYSLWRWITGSPAAEDGAGVREPSDYWVTLGTAGLATAISAALIVLFGARWGASATVSILAAIVSVASTHQLVYGTMYYGHAVAGCLLLASLYSLGATDRSFLTSFFAGLFAGLAIATEYTAAIYSVVVTLVLLAQTFTLRRTKKTPSLASFLLGHFLPLIALGYYHVLVTGSPLQVPYTMEADEQFAFHRQQSLPIGLPTLEGTLGLLIDPDRGLLPMTGISLFAIPGLWFLFRQGRKQTAAIIALSFTGMFVAMAGFPNWHGGLALGPRLLLPMFPMWMAATIPTLNRLWNRGGFAGFFGVWLLVAFLMMSQMAVINVVGQELVGLGLHAHLFWNHLDELNVTQGHIGVWTLGQNGSASLVVTWLIVTLIASIGAIVPIFYDHAQKSKPTTTPAGN